MRVGILGSGLMGGKLGRFLRGPARRRTGRPSLVYCGDDENGKATAAGLIRDTGFDPVDAGPLRIARYTEPFALLVAQLAYDGTGGRNWLTGSSGLGIDSQCRSLPNGTAFM
jgi:hypothetical protein